MNNSMNVGVITGGNNNFSQNNNFNQKNVYNNGGGNKPEGDPTGTGAAVCLSVFAVTVVIAVSYLNNYETIAFWLKLAVMAGGALHLLTLFSQALDSSYRYRDSLAPVGGITLTALLAWLTLTTFTALPDQVFAIAAQPAAALGYFQQMLEVWQRFNNHGHSLILENLTSALFLATGALFNLAFGLQQVIESTARVQQSSALATISHWMRFFRSGGVFIAAMTILGAYLAISGVFTARIA